MKCLCAGTRRAARLITQLYEAELRKVELTAAQFELLSTLRGRPGAPQSILAETLGLNQTTLSRNLAILLEKDWIESDGSPGDKRKTLYKLSREGLAVWNRALPHWRHAQDGLRKSLGADWETVQSALEKLAGVSP